MSNVPSPTAHRPVWIVGVDGSDESRQVLHWAVSLADRHHALVKAVMVATMPQPVVAGSPVVMPDLASFRDSAEEHLADIVRSTPHAPGQAIEQLVIVGHPSSALIDVASGADLMIVGSRGRGGFARLILGSVSHQCAIHSPVPVIVVPSPTRRAAHVERVGDRVGQRPTVVIGVDGSENSLAAMRWAFEFLPDARFIAIGAWDSMLPTELPDPERGVLESEARKRFVAEVDDAVAATGGEIDVETEWERGDPRTALLDASAEADLVVTGMRGHGAIGAAILGSVSTWLLHRAEVPMALVPHDRDG